MIRAMVWTATFIVVTILVLQFPTIGGFPSQWFLWLLIAACAVDGVLTGSKRSRSAA